MKSATDLGLEFSVDVVLGEADARLPGGEDQFCAWTALTTSCGDKPLAAAGRGRGRC